MNNFEHIVIVRCAVKFNNNVNFDDWFNKRMLIYNKYTRPSLNNQTNKDFKILSFVDISLKGNDKYFEYFNNMLNNEITIYVNGPKTSIASEIKKYVTGLDKNKSIIISRLDNDDMYGEDYIDIIQKKLLIDNTYLDISKMKQLLLSTNKLYHSRRYSTIVSPFVSVKESINNFKNIVGTIEHSYIGQKIKGIKLSELDVTQIIHDNNVMNKYDGGEEIK